VKEFLRNFEKIMAPALKKLANPALGCTLKMEAADFVETWHLFPTLQGTTSQKLWYQQCQLTAAPLYLITELVTSYQYTILILKIQNVITPHFPTHSTVNTRHDFPAFRFTPFSGRPGYKMKVLASDCSLNDVCLCEKAECPCSNLIHIIGLSVTEMSLLSR
jgi:hypothetical protein